VLTAGVDLAAEPKGTALAIIDWSASQAKLLSLQLGIADDGIVDACQKVNKIGIDCALGWPVEFVEFLTSHSELGSSSHAVDGGMDWRRRLSYRETDRAVRAISGRWPLSVATDRLGLTAMRAAGLLGRLELGGIPIDRSGAGVVVEVYPGATLRLWGFDTKGYRASAEARELLLGAIKRQAPWLDLSNFRSLMAESCDAFDSVIAALATRSAALGFYEPPTSSQLEQAKIEGWIALPNQPLEALISGNRT
jgi:predicted nuclease with RNAse H fold